MDKFLKRKRDDVKNNSTTSYKNPKFHWLYSDEYLKFGFHWTEDTQIPSSLCFVCGQTLFNEAMVPSKLKRHLTTNHPSLQANNVNYFQRLLESNIKQSQLFEKTFTVFEKAQLASFIRVVSRAGLFGSGRVRAGLFGSGRVRAGFG